MDREGEESGSFVRSITSSVFPVMGDDDMTGLRKSRPSPGNRMVLGNVRGRLEGELEAAMSTTSGRERWLGVLDV